MVAATAGMSLIEDWLRLAAARVAERRGWLTDLDGAIGDGDHGINAAVALAAAVQAIATLGRSHVGEKTMLDALVPAARAFAEAADGHGLAVVTARAADAADSGAAATVPLLATKGRASYLGERSRGHLDPGAASAALLLRALADVAAAR